MTFDNSRFVLRYTYLTCRTEVFNANAVQLTAYFFRNNRSTCQGCNILQHSLATIPESGSLYGNGFKCTAQLVDYESCQGFAFYIFGNNQKFLTGLYYFFQGRQHFLNGCDFTIRYHNIRFGHNGFHLIRIRYHVRRNIPAIELHTFYNGQLRTHGFRFFNRNNAVFTDLFHSIGNQAAYFFISRGNGSDLCNGFFIVDFNSTLLNFFYQAFDSLFYTAFQNHRIGTGCNITHAFLNHSLCQ